MLSKMFGMDDDRLLGFLEDSQSFDSSPCATAAKMSQGSAPASISIAGSTTASSHSSPASTPPATPVKSTPVQNTPEKKFTFNVPMLRTSSTTSLASSSGSQSETATKEDVRMAKTEIAKVKAALQEKKVASGTAEGGEANGWGFGFRVGV